jgi:hypothetical protein
MAGDSANAERTDTVEILIENIDKSCVLNAQSEFIAFEFPMQ